MGLCVYDLGTSSQCLLIGSDMLVKKKNGSKPAPLEGSDSKHTPVWGTKYWSAGCIPELRVEASGKKSVKNWGHTVAQALASQVCAGQGC